MNIAILSTKRSLYSTKRLKTAGEQRGHQIQILDYMRCYTNITSQQMAAVHYRGKPATSFDAVIPRIAVERTFYGAAIVRQFETTGTYTINPSIGITRSRDKLRSQQLLAMRGIDIPNTAIAHDPGDIDRLFKIVGNPPWVIKLVEGTQGVGVVLAETKQAAESVMQTLMGLKANMIVQEFIQESSGTDIRCFIIGNKVVAAIQRQARMGEFRANIHRGASATPITITKEEREMAVRAAKIMGLRMAGVDLLRSKRGPLVLEINSSPGLEGIETATTLDIAGLIIEYIEKHAKQTHRKSRYEG